MCGVVVKLRTVRVSCRTDSTKQIVYGVDTASKALFQLCIVDRVELAMIVGRRMLHFGVINRIVIVVAVRKNFRCRVNGPQNEGSTVIVLSMLAS